MNSASVDPKPSGTAIVKAGSETVFVLGNGPSLASVDLHSLSNYATIGLNAAYRYWREIDWRPRRYACLDLVVGMSHRDEIADLILEGRIEHFFLRQNLIDALGTVARTDRVVSYEAKAASDPLFTDPAVTTGAGAALWAASEGFQQIILLGVDGKYTEIVRGAEKRSGSVLEIVRDEDNPNYFFEGYQQPGDRYQTPNPRPDLHLNSWRSAGTKIQATGADVFNANPSSSIRCFPFVDLMKYLDAGVSPTAADEQLPVGTTSESASAFTERAHSFVSANARLLGSVGAASLLSGTAALWVGAPTNFFILVVLLVLISFALVYLRHATITRFAAMQRRIDELDALVKDIHRRDV